jgi:hypothetical protein
MKRIHASYVLAAANAKIVVELDGLTAVLAMGLAG